MGRVSLHKGGASRSAGTGESGDVKFVSAKSPGRGVDGRVSMRGWCAFDGRTCELKVEEWIETGSKRHGGCGEKVSELRSLLFKLLS